MNFELNKFEQKIVHCDLADGLQLLNFVGNEDRFALVADEETVGSLAGGDAAADGSPCLLDSSGPSIS